ncbi:MAG: hypothetical protein ACRD82_14615, partial [Blastocatellia bacterium]
ARLNRSREAVLLNSLRRITAAQSASDGKASNCLNRAKLASVGSNALSNNLSVVVICIIGVRTFPPERGRFHPQSGSRTFRPPYTGQNDYAA